LHVYIASGGLILCGWLCVRGRLCAKCGQVFDLPGKGILICYICLLSKNGQAVQKSILQPIVN
jgi:hypothetical protein